MALAASTNAHGQHPPSDSAEISRMVRDASRAIQAGNAASFLNYFERDEFADFPTLRSHVTALASQRQIASSIEITELENSGDGYELRVSWILQLTYTGDPGPVESRRESVACSVRKFGKSWKIVHLEPVLLFRP
ncbi:MAG TPA: hypothetical protein VLD18_07200 [Verrucomicrobiae bacterium]|nr:hypothetical protein [Verrucomicrobiae bacterium]